MASKASSFLSSLMLLLSSYLGSQSEFDWVNLQSQDNITWVPCYGSMQCARYNVPLNYSDPGAGSATLAMIQIPANVSKDSKDYGGPLFFNPGGPGNSGVEFMQSSGAYLQSILGPTFDIVSFDPRGIGRSTPQASFFTNHIERTFWDFGPATIDMNASTDAIPRNMARYKVLGQMAKDRDQGILEFITTDNVARDMLRMTQALGTEKLKYWGISYGSALGQTFAAMFPDKVDKLAIDGVLDGEAYYSNDWSSQLQDTEKTLQTFFDGCFASGPTSCPFYAPSPSLIKSNLNTLLSSVSSQPIPAYSNSSSFYGIVDYATLRTAVFYSMYSPYNLFQPLAGALALLQTGDGSGVYELVNTELGVKEAFKDQCSANATGSFETVDFENVNEGEMAVACADGVPVSGDVGEMRAYADRIRNISVFSDFVVGERLRCSGWKVSPPHFTGPLTGNTSFPMLVIGNTADPVTPHSLAELVSSRFPSSVVLTQDSSGHTSFVAPSTCTAGHVRAYFVNGTLPAEGVVCPVDIPLFPPPATNSSTAAAVAAARRGLDYDVVVRRSLYRLHPREFKL